MKPKAKTLIEKCGFLDPDRKSPLHDEMQIWVMKNFWKVLSAYTYPVDAFITSVREVEKEVTRPKIVFENGGLPQINGPRLASLLPDDSRGDGSIRKLYQEKLAETVPVTEKSVERVIDRSRVVLPFTDKYWDAAVFLENKVSQEGYKSQNIVGFIDLLIHLTTKKNPLVGTNQNEGKEMDISGHTVNFAIELKTEIPSLGDLIRQINFYRPM